MKWLKRFGLLVLVIIVAWLVYAQVAMKYRMSDAEAKIKFKKAGVDLFIATIEAKGHLLHYVKTGSDTMPTLFFVHGSPGGWIRFKRYMQDKDLLKKYRMIAIDRPGFGYSEYGQVQSLQEQSDIITVLLKKIQNGKPIYSVGRSYGGSMIAKLAEDNPGMFSGMVLVAAALDPDAEKPEKWRPAMINSPLKYFLPGAWRASNEELWHLKKELPALAANLSTITCPVFILHGDRDGLVPVRNAAFAKKMLVNAKSVSVTIIPGANHFVSDHHYELVKETLMKLN